MAQKTKPQAETLYGLPQPLQSNLFPPVIASRNPTSADTGYPLGTSWINKVNDTAWVLTSVAAGAAAWQEDAGGSIIVSSLSGDTGTATPTAGNIKIAGTTNEIVTAASGSTVTVSLPSAVTVTTLHATTIDTNVAAAELSLNGTTLSATGSNADVSLNLATKGTGSILFTRSAAGIDLNEQITNSDNTSGTSNAGIQLATGGASSGDPYLSFQISGVGASTMTMGLDNSASDTFVISNSTALGTSNALTLTQAGALNATTSITAGTSLTATLGNIQATNGNLVLNTAGNKIVSTSVGTTTAAGANSFGSVTLTGGTATVSTTSVTASSLIVIWRQSIGATGAAALGHLTVGTITAATSFVINAVQAADATALQASDVSVVGWMIIN